VRVGGTVAVAVRVRVAKGVEVDSGGGVPCPILKLQAARKKIVSHNEAATLRIRNASWEEDEWTVGSEWTLYRRLLFPFGPQLSKAGRQAAVPQPAQNWVYSTTWGNN